MRFITTLIALATASTAVASPVLVGSDFAYNQGNGMPADELALAVYYDGSGQAEMGFEVRCPNSGTEWVLPGLVSPGVITTFTYDMQGCELTGRTGARGVVPNGSVDGIAFGMFWKDSGGDAHILKSNQSKAGQHVLGVWPTGFVSDSSWIDANAPSISSGREIVRTLIPGAVLVDNGLHRFEVF